MGRNVLPLREVKDSQGWNMAGKGKSGIEWALPERQACGSHARGTDCYPKSSLEPVKGFGVGVMGHVCTKEDHSVC